MHDSTVHGKQDLWQSATTGILCAPTEFSTATPKNVPIVGQMDK